MAIGEKLPVVMGAEKGVLNGVATLDENGRLVREQRPNANGIFLPDGVTSINTALDNKADNDFANLPSSQTALYNLGGVPISRTINKKVLSKDISLDIGDVGGSNPNLLDNWYFADPIDQRNGYIVNSGATYYSDSALTTRAGTTSAAMTAQYVNATYGTIAISGTTYYVAAANVVRGYTNGIASMPYTIDRWYAGRADIKVSDSGISIAMNNTASGDNGWIQQQTEHNLSGQTVTVSVLYDGGFYTKTLQVPSVVDRPVAGEIVDNLQCQIYYYKTQCTSVVIRSYTTTPKNLIAAKLELGPVQTLAHQDASGNWVLNDPPPNKALELLKCQRYFFAMPLIGGVAVSTVVTDSGGIAYFPIYLPVCMQYTPTIHFTGNFRVHGEGANYQNISLGNVGMQGNIITVQVLSLTPFKTYTLDAYPTGNIFFDANL